MKRPAAILIEKDVWNSKSAIENALRIMNTYQLTQFAQTNKNSGHLQIDWYFEGEVLPRKKEKMATKIDIVTKT